MCKIQLYIKIKQTYPLANRYEHISFHITFIGGLYETNLIYISFYRYSHCCIGLYGFFGQTAAVSKELNPTFVKTVSTLPDNTIVTLTGAIAAKHNVEEYMFRDSTGEIWVEFDDDDIPMGGFAVGTKMKIMGEVDKEIMLTKVDAKNYKLMK